MKTIKKINYDTTYDILYIITDDNHNSYGDEDDNGVVYLRNGRTDNIVGLIIYDLLEKIADNTISTILSEVDINFAHDILPSLNNI